MRPSFAALALVGLLALGACGEGETAGDEHAGMDMGDQSESAASGAGSPAPKSDAERTIRIEALDRLRFSPSSLEVEGGQAVTFKVTNAGEMDHEFSLGEESFHDDHAAEMDGDHSMTMDSAAAISLAPGETKEITWTFPQSGEVVYACHVPGHFDGGMLGRITVE